MISPVLRTTNMEATRDSMPDQHQQPPAAAAAAAAAGSRDTDNRQAWLMRTRLELQTNVAPGRLMQETTLFTSATFHRRAVKGLLLGKRRQASCGTARQGTMHHLPYHSRCKRLQPPETTKRQAHACACAFGWTSGTRQALFMPWN